MKCPPSENPVGSTRGAHPHRQRQAGPWWRREREQLGLDHLGRLLGRRLDQRRLDRRRLDGRQRRLDQRRLGWRRQASAGGLTGGA